MSRHNETPDWWIERNPDDDGCPPMTDAEMCEERVCDHVDHCEECHRGFDYELPTDGICMDCRIALVAKRPQLPSILQSEEDKRRKERNERK